MTVLLLASQLTPEQEQRAAFDALAYALVLIFVVGIGAVALMAAWDWWRAGPCPFVLPVTLDGQPCPCRQRAGHVGPHRHGPFTDTTPTP